MENYEQNMMEQLGISLSEKEKIKYSRQIILPEIGEEGQKKLKQASVVVVGLGGLGTIGSIYLAAAGIGRIKIIDNEKVETSNLNRQILYWERDIGRLKVESAYEKLKQINEEVKIDISSEEVREENIHLILEGYDAIFDGLDKMKTRFLLNKAAFKLKIPFFHGAIYGFEGRATTIIPGRTACLRCFLKCEPPEETFPVLGAVCALIASIQTIEIIKYFTNAGILLANRYLIYDGKNMEFKEVKIEVDPNCEVCQQV